MKTWQFKPLIALGLAFSLILGLFGPLALAEPEAADTLRVHYQAEDGVYEDLGLWIWGDVVTPSEQVAAWPDGRTLFPEENRTANSAYLDIPLMPEAKQVGILVIDGQGSKRTPEDVLIDLLTPDMREVWVGSEMTIHCEDLWAIPEGAVRVHYQAKGEHNENLGLWFWGDVATSSEQTGGWPLGATPMVPNPLTPGASYLDVELAPDAKELGYLFVDRATGEQTVDYALDVSSGQRSVYMREGDDTPYQNLYGTVGAAEQAEPAVALWKEKDALYYTEAPLGARLMPDGSAQLALWAPTADRVELVLYDKDDQHKVIKDDLQMQMGDELVWQIELNEANTGLSDLDGYFYHYRVWRGDQGKLVLDPYARSMAAWDSGNSQGEAVGKAAIVDPALDGGTLDYAQVPGYVDREDAIIYELHVRDYTADPSIAGELGAAYGGFAALESRLDYIKDLGVTHIQLLPVLNYYHVNEHDRSRSPEYASEQQNYNWGYDPQSYFALTGMYASNPDDPQARIREFQSLVNAIHARGMGVILDVVYNHTAKIELFEDIEPGYYYFADAAGRPKGSFGGGQMGSTHLMVRRLITDSLVYLTDTYKVDGFRFDMMGNLDGETIDLAYERVKALNPNTLWIGEGWRTFNGDAGEQVIPADQDWMGETDAVAVFSDELRNELKSGFGSEGQPRFVTGGKRSIELLHENMLARPKNVSEDDPGDVVQYIAAHDNLTLHDVIALSIRKDPKDHEEEIIARQRLANALLMTHQGIIFLHAGQEYGRTKQFRHPDYIGKVELPPAKSTFFADAEGQPFEYPYFIHDSYDASDAVNQFDWQKALHSPLHAEAVAYMSGLAKLRRSTDAFSYATAEQIDSEVLRVLSPSIAAVDLVIAYQARSERNGESYLVVVNADSQTRRVELKDLELNLDQAEVVVDQRRAGTEALAEPIGLTLEPESQGTQLEALVLEPLTAAVLRLTKP